MCCFTLILRPLTPPGWGMRKATAIGGMSLTSIRERSKQPHPPCRGVNVSHRHQPPTATSAWRSVSVLFELSMFIFPLHDLFPFTALFIGKTANCSGEGHSSTGSHWETLCAFQSPPPYLSICVFTDPLFMISDISVSTLCFES